MLKCGIYEKSPPNRPIEGLNLVIYFCALWTVVFFVDLMVADLLGLTGSLTALAGLFANSLALMALRARSVAWAFLALALHSGHLTALGVANFVTSTSTPHLAQGRVFIVPLYLALESLLRLALHSGQMQLLGVANLVTLMIFPHILHSTSLNGLSVYLALDLISILALIKASHSGHSTALGFANLFTSTS